jgi:hypothetical protein
MNIDSNPSVMQPRLKFYLGKQKDLKKLQIKKQKKIGNLTNKIYKIIKHERKGKNIKPNILYFDQ